MLVSLHIENIAVIEKADVEFDKGFCVLTGETGAGKSILIDSINAVLGERASKDLIRTGCQNAVVSAVFSNVPSQIITKLSLSGIDVSDNEIMIARIISDSKSVAKINAQTVTASFIREIAPMLVNIHGQHDSQHLLIRDNHYIYIDELAQNHKLLEQYNQAFSQMQTTRRRLTQLTQNLQDKEKRIELLNYQISELERAQIKLNEKEYLLKQKEVLSNALNIKNAIFSAYTAIHGDETNDFNGAISLAETALSDLTPYVEMSKEISTIHNDLYNVVDNLTNVKEEISSFMSNYDLDESELDEVEQRLEMYYRLSLKYGETEDEMLNYYSSIKNEVNTIKSDDEEFDLLQEQLLNHVEHLKKVGAQLTLSRTTAAKIFEQDVEKQLEFMNMPNVKILVDIKKQPYSTTGADDVEIMLSANLGEPPKPLAKIASGGELSRIMLAIKNVLSSKDHVPTLIFDEIDTGVSGQAAKKVAIKLKETANGKQVICVTHLAQIASMADNHFLIEKNIVNNRTLTTIKLLDFEGRKYELARIIGSEITETTLQSAQEMLMQSHKA